jgi:hypothetical protein
MDFMHFFFSKVFGYVFNNLAHSNTDRYISMVCPVFRALIRCTKCVEDQLMHCNFIDVPLLHYGYNHVSARNVAITQGDFCENKNTVVITCLNHSTILKTHIIAGYNSLLNNAIK